MAEGTVAREGLRGGADAMLRGHLREGLWRKRHGRVGQSRAGVAHTAVACFGKKEAEGKVMSWSVSFAAAVSEASSGSRGAQQTGRGDCHCLPECGVRW